MYYFGVYIFQSKMSFTFFYSQNIYLKKKNQQIMSLSQNTALVRILF